MGPIAGATFQPWFGAWSDRTRTSWGRRKPFIVTGAMLMIASLLIFAWADEIANFLAHSVYQTADRSSVVVLSVCAAFVFWTSAQAVQVGLRALISDHCTATENIVASAWAGSYSNLAAVMGNLSAYVSGRYSPDSSVFRTMTLFSAFILAATSLISCLSTQDQTCDTKGTTTSSLWSSGKWLLCKSCQIRNICLTQLFAWGAWFPFLFYVKSYVNNLYKLELQSTVSDTSSSLLHTDLGSTTLLGYSVIALCMGLILPKAVSNSMTISICGIWKASLGFLSVAMLSTFIISSSSGSVVLFIVLGLSGAASSWIPYALLGAESSRISQSLLEVGGSGHNAEDAYDFRAQEDESTISEQLGMAYGIHNLFVCLPQIFICTGIGAASLVTDSEHMEQSQMSAFDPVWILRLGGISALVATSVATFVNEPLRPSSGGIVETDQYEL